ncbi:patatin-like phospholipase family protein [Chitinimonas sp. PSY-7]|uniref:patatin-like phospholipase family protein n=1 Tax=Chitinimonas sp. PSY-7 TaxID=3459088 RepID=UPI00403FCBD4
MLFSIRLAVLVGLLTVHAADAAEPERPRVALVLGGGGARGLAHIGVLKVLEEARIPVDCVVGTSMGALVGGLYATGRTAGEISTDVKAIDWDDVLNDRPNRAQRRYHDKQDDWVGLAGFQLGLSDNGQLLFPKSALGTQKVDLLIRRLVQGATVEYFDDLPMPYRAVAADLEGGDMVVLSRGDLSAAMRASMAVPGVFPPVERDTRVLIDGGIARNLPVDVARGVCGDVVIAVDVGSPLLSRKEASDVLAISDQTMRVLTQRNVDEQVRKLTQRDILIRPSLGTMSSSSFTEVETAQQVGERAARDLLPKLQSLSMSEEDYAAWRTKIDSRRFKPGLIRSVDVEPTRFVNPEILRELLDVKLGKPLDVDALEQRLDYVYGRDDFEQIDYHLVPAQDGHAISLSAREKPWGPRYLDLGLGLRTDFEDESGFLLSAQYKRTWMNSLGADWKTRVLIGEKRGIVSEFYQPLALNSELFIALNGSVNSRSIPLYSDDEIKIAGIRKTRRVIRFDIGSTWGRWGEVRLGVERAKSRFTIARLIPDLASSIDPRSIKNTQDDGGIRLSLGYDQLDSAQYPRSGTYAHLEAFRSMHDIGTGSKLYLANLDLKQAFRAGKWSLLVGMSGSAISSDEQVDLMPSVGGLFNLSGYADDQLRGQRIIRTQVRLSRDLVKFSSMFSNAGFIGISLESARIWDRYRIWDNEDYRRGYQLRSSSESHQSLALFVGSDTRIGPAYLAVGYGDNKKARIFLNINGGF